MTAVPSAGPGSNGETGAEATHVPCCSAHGVPMTCERYRRTHFVEVRPCCADDREAMTR